MEREKLEKTFAMREITLLWFEDAASVLSYLQEQTRGKRVAMGGSTTLDQLGVYENLPEVEVHWHWKVKGDYYRNADVYLSSANALAETGEIVNIDGSGNRTSSILYGSETVFFVCGANKWEADLERAIFRARNIAAPQNAQRLGAQTPCAVKADRCYNCRTNNPASICRALLVLERKPMSVKKMEVLVINQHLGY